MAVETNIRVTGITETLRKLSEVEAILNSPEPMGKIVADVREAILDKTSRGLDYMGRRFAPYSKAYAKRKKQSKVDLKLSGETLDSIQATVINPGRGEVAVTSPGRQVIANIHNTGTGKQPKREFMNMSKSAVRALVKKYIDDEILKIARQLRMK